MCISDRQLQKKYKTIVVHILYLRPKSILVFFCIRGTMANAEAEKDRTMHQVLCGKGVRAALQE